MIRRYIMLILCLAVMLSIGGVNAMWMYAELPPQPTEKNLNVSLSVFDYPPEEVLPGGGGGGGGESGDTDGVEIGENHYMVINIIVNTADKNYDLNDPDSLFHSLLEKESVVYSNQKTSGGNLKFVLNTSLNTHRLYYCVQKVDDSTYYVYTFSMDELATASGSSNEITVYRTTVVKSDEWKSTVSYLGYAKTVRLSDIGVSAQSQDLKYSIDVYSWHQ